MSEFDWTHELSVGFPEIDASHQSLFTMLNELSEALNQGQASQAVKPLLARLRQYARTHFSEEERLMDQYGYPDLETHRQAHDTFIDQMLDFEVAHLEGRDLLALDLLSFLRGWIVRHVAEADKGYADFFVEKGLTRL